MDLAVFLSRKRRRKFSLLVGLWGVSHWLSDLLLWSLRHFVVLVIWLHFLILPFSHFRVFSNYRHLAEFCYILNVFFFFRRKKQFQNLKLCAFEFIWEEKMMDYLAGIYNNTVIQWSAWISRWVFGNKDRFLTVNWQKWSWCHFIKGCLILSHLISTCRFSFIQQVKVDIISYPLVCHIPSFHGVHSTVAGIVIITSE